jgi:23S rRNA G2445 N2-methylase RlmL
MNPPYGKRIADDDTAGIYSRLSYIFENCILHGVFVLSFLYHCGMSSPSL